MNRKILVIFVALLAMAMLMMFAVMPVLAEPAQHISVTAVTSNQVNGTPEIHETKGGIVHQIFTRTGVVTLTIEGQAPIVGTISEVVHQTRNTKTNEIVIQNFDSTWTFAGGSFTGVKQTRITIGSPTVVEQHVVFQGSGIFAGCTLKLTQEVPPTPAVYTGVMIVP